MNATSIRSVNLEHILEHRFLADTGTVLWQRGIHDLDIMRSEAEVEGHDLVLEANGVIRHVQLKIKAVGGKRSSVNVHLRLAGRPSACIIWILYNPEDLQIDHYQWFGSMPGRPIPDLGTRPVKHSRANSEGVKQTRPGQRYIPVSRFRFVESAQKLATALFGMPLSEQLAILKRNLEAAKSEPNEVWHGRVVAGDFTAIPEDISWNSAQGLARMINGQGLIEEMDFPDAERFIKQQWEAVRRTGIWCGTAPELWATLSLLHSEYNLVDGDRNIEHYGLCARKVMQLDQLCQRLRRALVEANQ